jgi:hypothetical protein
VVLLVDVVPCEEVELLVVGCACVVVEEVLLFVAVVVELDEPVV